MQLRRCTAVAAMLLLCPVLVGLGVSGCGGGSSSNSPTTTRNAPVYLYGTWKLVQTSGGFTGQGTPINEETLETFDRSGNTTRTEAGRVVLSGKFQVTRNTDHFGDPLPVLDVVNESGDLATTGRAIVRADSTHLTLSDDAADGIQSDYERVN